MVVQFEKPRALAHSFVHNSKQGLRSNLKVVRRSSANQVLVGNKNGGEG